MGGASNSAEKEATGTSSPFFISVVIVNYNATAYLERCLSAVCAQDYPALEIIVVDNASTDGSAEAAAKRFPQVQLLRSPKNIGFAAGTNLGIRAANGELIATLNPDTQVERGYFSELAAPMREPRVGMCAPLMVKMEQRDIVDSAGITIDPFGFAWNIGAGERVDVYAMPRRVFGASAGAALYRRKMLDEIGLFDEDYFAFYEDADLAWRARNAGWEAVFVPTARVYHVHGGSFGRASPRKSYLLARNRWWTLVKNYRMSQLLFYLPAIAVVDVAALIRAMWRFRSLEPLRGRLDASRQIRKMLAKRRALQNVQRENKENAWAGNNRR